MAFNPLNKRDRELMCVGVGWGRVLCYLDTACHEWLHLPHWLMWPVCNAHDRRLMRSLADENDLHTETLQQWWNTSTSATVGDVKITTRRPS